MMCSPTSLPAAAPNVADIIVSAEAERDLEDIEAYSFARFGEEVGTDYMQGFGNVFSRLREYPALGTLIPRLRPPLRTFSYRSHRLLYDFDGNRIVIVRILHQAMNVARATRN